MLFDNLLLLADSEPSGLAAFGGQVLLWARVALGIGLVIFVHELGHFVAAKTFGVKCEKFYVGFDPPIKIGPIKIPSSLGKFRYGETEYGIGIIPLGGYVKMLGQDDDPRKFREESARAHGKSETTEDDAFEDSDAPASDSFATEELDPRSLPAKPVWQRMIIMSAGVFMNLVTGALFAMIAYFYGVPYTPAIVGGPSAGGPAWKAGIQPGGEIVAVDGVDEDQMHFREMQSAIIHAGLETPDRAVPVSIAYAGQTTEFNLKTEPFPAQKSRPMIGIMAPDTLELYDSVTSSVAESILAEEHNGAVITAYDGIDVDEESLLPAMAFQNYLYSNPTKSIDLKLRKVEVLEDESEKVTNFDVTLPPQPSHSVGFRPAVGKVSALIASGPAAQAGMKVGDVIESVEGVDELDTESLLLHLARREPVQITVRRGEETATLSITPNDALQTLPPLSRLGYQAAFNAFGFAFNVPNVVGTFDKSCLVEGDALEPGDELKEIKLLAKKELPEKFTKAPYKESIQGLQKGWKFEDDKNASLFVQNLQVLPEGTQFKLLSKGPKDGVIKESILEIKADPNRVRFERGLNLVPVERIQTASSVSEAAALGIRESGRRFSEVLRFLKMAVTGRVSTEHVGGPIRIFQVAGSQAEQGISKQLLFLTLLSMNLAILNFLPIPVLDGGHMVFLFCELVMGRRVNEEVEMRLTLVGGIMLLGLMVFVVFNDIINF